MISVPNYSHSQDPYIFLISIFNLDFEIDAQWVLRGNQYLIHTLFIFNLFEMSLELMQTEIGSESGLSIEITI